MNSITTTNRRIDVEAQLLRDGEPWSRPTRWAMFGDTFEPRPEPFVWKLNPGAANGYLSDGIEYVAGLQVALVHLGYITPQWVNIVATISVEGQVYPSRPAQLFIDDNERWPSGAWGAHIHFPIMSNRQPYAGTFTLLLRTIVGAL